jgi:DNA-binding GntR family transcriptional regulator
MDDDKVALPSLARENLAEEAYQVLRDRIFSRQFACGERLDLPSIEHQLGVSRTPLKAALDRLATEGLVEIVPRRGTYVTTPTPQAIEDAFSVREVLEAHAVARSIDSMTEAQLEQLAQIVHAMLRITRVDDHAPIYDSYAELDHSFHSLIVEAAANDVLTKLWNQVHAHVQIARIRYRRGDRRLDLTTREHGNIFAAFQARDANAAEALMRDHIRRAKVSLQEDLQRLDSP